MKKAKSFAHIGHKYMVVGFDPSFARFGSKSFNNTLPRPKTYNLFGDKLNKAEDVSHIE